MNKNKFLLTAAAVAFAIGTGGALAQQELNLKGAAEKSAPSAPAAKSPASGAVQQNRTEQRSQAVQPGRRETTGQAPASNRAAEEPKSKEPDQAGARSNQSGENKAGQNTRENRTGQNTRSNERSTRENQRSTTGQA